MSKRIAFCFRRLFSVQRYQASESLADNLRISFQIVDLSSVLYFTH